jgi:cell division protein YceG involved in septum cleavage
MKQKISTNTNVVCLCNFLRLFLLSLLYAKKIVLYFILFLSEQSYQNQSKQTLNVRQNHSNNQYYEENLIANRFLQLVIRS